MHKLRLSERSHKHQLGQERNKQVALQKKLDQALRDIEDLRKELKVD